MAVFYNSHSGAYHTASQSLNPVAEADFLAYEALLHTGIGWHQYPDVAAMNAGVAAHPGWPKPTSNLAKATGQAAGQAAQAAGNAATNALGLPRFSNLRDFVVRSVKVIIGALLIITGVSSLLKSQGIDVPKPPAVIPV
jgi:hypothetical protein